MNTLVDEIRKERLDGEIVAIDELIAIVKYNKVGNWRKLYARLRVRQGYLKQQLQSSNYHTEG